MYLKWEDLGESVCYLQDYIEYVMDQGNKVHAPSHFTRKPPTQYSENYHMDKLITRLKLGATKLPGCKGHLIIRNCGSQCGTCQTTFNIRHFLLECPTFSVARDGLLRELKLMGMEPLLENILDPNPSNMHRVYEILSDYIIETEHQDKI